MATPTSLNVASLYGKAHVLLQGTDERACAQRAALFAFGIRVASAGIAFVSQIFLARWVGAFEFGIFAYVWVWVFILGSLSTCGLNTSVLRFIPDYRDASKFNLLRGFVGASRLTVVAVSSLLALMGVGLLMSMEGLVSDYYIVPLILGAVCLPMFALTDLQDGISRTFSWIDLALAPPYIIRPLLLLILFAIAIVSGAEASGQTAILAMIGAAWIAAIGQTLVLNKRLDAEIAPVKKSYDYGLWIKISMPIMLVDGFYILMTHSDIVILNLFLGPEDIAIYYAAVKTTSLVSFVYFAVVAAQMHKFSGLHAAGKTGQLDQLLRESISWIFWPSLLAAAVILAMGLPLLSLYGSAFVSGYSIMVILAIGLLVRAAFGPLEFVLNVLGQQKSSAIVLFTAVVLNIGLNFLLIPRFGLEGAAAATTLTVVYVCGVLFTVVKIRLGLHPFIIGGPSHRCRSQNEVAADV
jgi:O-antigen/teichoic acid export membrane protein